MSLQLPADLIDRIRKLPKPTIIAIGGYGGSGKTTLAEAIRQKFDSVAVFHMDDFIDKDRILEPSWDKGGFDRDRLKRQVLKPLSARTKPRYQKLVWETNGLSDFIKAGFSGLDRLKDELPEHQWSSMHDSLSSATCQNIQ